MIAINLLELMKFTDLNIARKDDSKLKKMSVQISEECLKNEKNFEDEDKDEDEDEDENEDVKD